jgi:hypothetical protein
LFIVLCLVPYSFSVFSCARFFGFIEVLLWGTRVMEVQHHDTGHAGGPAAQSQRARTTHNGPVARERHVAKARGVGKRYMYGALATCLSRVSVHCALFAPSGSVPRALQRALCHGVALPQRLELELLVIQTHMTQKPLQWVEAGAHAVRKRSECAEVVWAGASVAAWRLCVCSLILFGLMVNNCL